MVTRVIAALALLSVMGQPVYAGISRFHIPSTAFRLVRGDPANCFMTTTDNVAVGQGALGSQPEWVMGTPVGQTDCVIATPFTMPLSNTSIAGVIGVTIYAADGTSTGSNYCYKSRFEIGDNTQRKGSLAQGWANINGTWGKTAAVTFTGTGNTFMDQKADIAPIIPALVSGPVTAVDCSGSTCNGLAGVLYIERCECGSAFCGTAPDAGGKHFLQNVDTYWTSP